LKKIILFYKKGAVKMLQSPVEYFRNVPKKECCECGQVIEEQAESYLMECDYCLSKRDE
jgi:YhfH-like protein